MQRVLFNSKNSSNSSSTGDSEDDNDDEALKSNRIINFIACGHSSSAAIDSTGELFTWGCNFDYRLMIADNRDKINPTLTHLSKLRSLSGGCSSPGVEQQYRVKHVSLGDSHTAVVTCDGSVYTAGSGNCGELGTKVCVTVE
jgi:E3 ubiquitin-protein ligase HERC4